MQPPLGHHGAPLHAGTTVSVGAAVCPIPGDIQQLYLRWATIPVVIVSAHAAPTQVERLEVAAVLTKPVPTEELLAVVERHHRRSLACRTDLV